MEAFLIFVLFVAVVVLLVRQSLLSGRVRSIEEAWQQAQRSAPTAPIAAPPPPVAAQRVVSYSPPPTAAAPVAEAVPVAAKVAEPAPVLPYRAPYIPPAVVFPQPPRETAAAPAPRASLEARLGQNWLNRLGILTLVVGIALLLGRELVRFGALGRVLTGVALAALLLGGGLWLERRPNYRIFARAGIGGGWGLTFFLAFAVQHVDALRLIDSPLADLVLMFVVAAAMVAHSLRYRSQVVTTLAFLLAFLTIGISHVTVFSLVAGAVLAAALAVIVARERWFALGLAGVAGVYLNHGLWLHRVLPAQGQRFPEFIASAALLIAYWLVFRVVYVLRAPEGENEQAVSALAAVLNSAGLLALLRYQSQHPEWAFWALLALGVVEFVLAFVARRGLRGNGNRVGFVVLSSLATVYLLAAVPFRYTNASWPLFWMLQAEALVLIGLRLNERVLRRLGVLASLATAALLLVLGSGVFYLHVHAQPRAGTRTLSVGITLLTTAMLLWLNAELAPRRWADLLTETFDRATLGLGSFAALPLAMMGTAVLLPGSLPGAAWVVVIWLAVAWVLALAADGLKSRNLATQVDLLAVVAVARLLLLNLSLQGASLLHLSLREATVVPAIVLLGLLSRRNLRAHLLEVDYIAASYAWAYTGLAGLLIWYEAPAAYIAPAWAALGLVLLEVGIRPHKDVIHPNAAAARQQAYVFFALSFVRLFYNNFALSNVAHHDSLRMLTVLPLIAAYAWVYERTQRFAAAEAGRGFDRIAGTVAVWLGLVSAAMLTWLEPPSEWVFDGFALLAALLLTVAVLVKRPPFVAQAYAMLVAAAVRGLLVNFADAAPTGPDGVLLLGFVHTRVFTVSLASVFMLAALPAAFALRKYMAAGEALDVQPLDLLRRPEQPFFFVPLLLTTLLLAVELHGGGITIGWSALGVLAFLFALAVGERSYRLSGLGLLLLGVGKLLAWDIWHASSGERTFALIAMGVALLLVSFLYSRFKETLLKLL